MPFHNIPPNETVKSPSKGLGISPQAQAVSCGQTSKKTKIPGKGKRVKTGCQSKEIQERPRADNCEDRGAQKRESKRESKGREVGYGRLRKDEKAAIWRREREEAQANHEVTSACIRYISEPNRKLERFLEVTEQYCGPKVRGVLKNSGKRGAVKMCSKDAMRRMKKAMGSLKGVVLNRMAELLPPDEFFEGCRDVADRADRLADHLHIMRQHDYFEKRGIKGYWKIEWKRRETGLYEGEFVPHIHLLLQVQGETQEERGKVVAGVQEDFIRRMRLPAKAEEKALQVNTHLKGNREIHSNKMAQIYATKYGTKGEDEEALKDEISGTRRSWGRLGGMKAFEEKRIYGFEDLELTEEDEKDVWEEYWRLVAEDKEKEWVEYPEGKTESEEQRQERRRRWENFMERIRRGKTFVYMNNTKLNVGDYLARAIAAVEKKREGCPF